MTVARLVFYSLDTVRTNLTVAKARRSKADVVIFDRYAYDEFVNLSSPRWLTGMCLKFLLRMTPRPDIAYLLDADPRLARERKPEYPIEFLQTNRAAYLALSALAGMTVINPLPPLEVSQKIMEEFRKHCSSGDADRPSSGVQQINSSQPGGSPIRTA
jgi:thymidylate kinase